MFCPQCGNSNDSSAKFCYACGFALPQVGQAAPAAQAGITTSINQVEFYKAAIGPKNQSYYLSDFQRFDNDGKIAASWHWPAFFITFYWLLYRKMWLNALIYFFVPFLVLISLGIISATAGASVETAISFGYILYLAGIFLLPPLYANALYYRHCRKKITQTSASSNDMQSQLGELSGKGGTINVALTFVIGFAVIGIFAAIAIPAYQDFITRARLAETASVENTSEATPTQAQGIETRARLAEAASVENTSEATPTQAQGIEWEVLDEEAKSLYQKGQYEHAVVVEKKALGVAEKAVGPNHSDVASILNNLALLYQTQGQYAQAEPLYKRSLAILEKALDPNHPDVARSLNYLAGLYDTQGQYAQAEPLYKRALAINEKALGPDHPAVATSLENMAALYRKIGRAKEAESLESRAARIRAITR